MQVPPEYVDREQTFLKHRVLDEYLLQWGHKLGSAARLRGSTKLWYVDAFAGPWNQRHPNLADTSVAIALDAIERAAETWRQRGHTVELAVVFVEKDDSAFAQLKTFLANRPSAGATTALHGEFGQYVNQIATMLGRDAAFIFVDPLGWKGAAMRYIEPLAKGPAPRDVLVNIMFDHLNRQKDRPVDHIREQMRDFFGLTDADLPAGLDEDGLLALYRQQMKSKCGLAYAADLAVPHPTMHRTKFRLAVGGRSPAVLEVFRDVEKKVLGAEAAAVRDDAARRGTEKRTGQLSLAIAAPTTDPKYDEIHANDRAAAERDLLACVSNGKVVQFDMIWAGILELRHITKAELRELVWEMHRNGRLRIRNAAKGERSTKDEHLLSLPDTTMQVASTRGS